MREAITGGKIRVREIWIAKGKSSSRAGEIRQLARAHHIPVLSQNTMTLSRLLPDITHQGIVARVEPFSYTELTALTEHPLNNQALLIFLDHITDEGNLGAIIRTALFFGAQGLILPKDRSAGITARVLKRSSGACFHLPIARVVNLGRSLDDLKKLGFWIIGASGESRETIYDFDWKRPIALVLGNEQKGLSPSVQKRCDQVVAIPASGPAESLNVAVAGGILMNHYSRIFHISN